MNTGVLFVIPFGTKNTRQIIDGPIGVIDKIQGVRDDGRISFTLVGSDRDFSG